MVDFQRGQLNLFNDAISSANLTQDWTLDQTGNWKEFDQGVTKAVAQTRTHDAVNEITDIGATSGDDWADPVHDANGNMTTIPQPNDLISSYTAKWDAWNRLVELTDNGEVVAAYQYDGTNRRIVVADNATVAGIDAGFLETDIEFFPEQWNGATGGPFPPGEFDATGSYFTTESETVNIGNINYGIAVDDNATGSGFMMYSVEDLHSRFGTSSSSNTTGVNANNADHLVAVRLNGTQWQYNSNYTWNNFNPVAGDRLLAEVDFSANTVSNRGWRRVYYSLSAQALEERLGSQVHQQYVWGIRFVDDLILRDRDTTDNGTLDERLYAMHDLRFSIVAVANASGVVQERYTYDAYGIRTVMDALFVEQSATDFDWQFAYTGRRRDSATGLYFFRARYYSAELGRFVGRDPLEFVDGLNLYRGYFAPKNSDPHGNELYVIDGTNAKWGDQTASQQLYEAARDQGQYRDGTGSAESFLGINNFNSATGFSDFAIIRRLMSDICDDYCAANSLQIDLLGWSRGAVAVLEIAQRLNDDGCECGGCVVKPAVNWIGLFDPVNMHIGTTNNSSVFNVRKISIAKRTGQDGQFRRGEGRARYGAWWIEGPTLYPRYPRIEGADVLFVTNTDGTRSLHGEVGGASTSEKNNSMEWMKSQAKRAGVEFIR